MKNPIFKDLKHNQEYLTKGYIKCNLLNESEVKSVLSEIKLLRPDDEFAPNRPNNSDYHCTFLDTNEDYKRATNKLFKATFNPKVDALFHDYHVWNANLYVKPPGKGKFEIHQNWTHVAKEQDTSFTMWCPLVDTNEDNGTLHLVDGSHKILPDIATMNTPYYFKNFEGELLAKYLKPHNCKAGDAIIFEDGMIHYSDVNRSNAPRYALQILIGPKNLSPVYYYLNQDKDNEFELIELNEEFFMQSNYTTFHERPKNQKSRGFMPNSNRLIDLKEFDIALKNGDQRRAGIYG